MERKGAGGEEHTGTGTTWEGPMGRSMVLVPSKVIGLGGSSDLAAATFRGGAKTTLMCGNLGPAIERRRPPPHSGIDFHKIFFHPPFLSSSLSLFLPVGYFALSASLPRRRRCREPAFDLRLSLLSWPTLGVGVSFPPCRAPIMSDQIGRG